MSRGEVIERVVRGFLVPRMQDDPIPGRPQRHGLGIEDYERVRQGYACPHCLAFWDDGVRMACPACLHVRSAQDIIDSATDWEDYLRERKHALENPTRTEMPSMAEMVDSIAGEQLDGWEPNRKRNL